MAKRHQSKSQHEDDRTEILRYLNLCGLQPVTPRSIVIFLDDCLRPVSADGVDFHLKYLRDKGWVELGVAKVLGEGERIDWARITAQGVDEFDRRPHALGRVR